MHFNPNSTQPLLNTNSAAALSTQSTSSAQPTGSVGNRPIRMVDDDADLAALMSITESNISSHPSIAESRPTQATALQLNAGPSASGSYAAPHAPTGRQKQQTFQWPAAEQRAPSPDSDSEMTD